MEMAVYVSRPVLPNLCRSKARPPPVSDNSLAEKTVHLAPHHHPRIDRYRMTNGRAKQCQTQMF